MHLITIYEIAVADSMREAKHSRRGLRCSVWIICRTGNVQLEVSTLVWRVLATIVSLDAGWQDC